MLLFDLELTQVAECDSGPCVKLRAIQKQSSPCQVLE